jgi:hypothetical protein
VAITGDGRSIIERTAALRREMATINHAESVYRGHRPRSLDDIAEHEKRELRMLEIREELGALLRRRKSATHCLLIQEIQ